MIIIPFRLTISMLRCTLEIVQDLLWIR
jgi:hypothetical protein